ncbi:hypothetical protein ACHAQA_003365 [Verticillium albo-atrum]
MEVLRLLSPKAFQDSAKFKVPTQGKQFEVRIIKIECDATGPTFHDLDTVREKDLKNKLDTPPAAAGAAAGNGAAPAPGAAATTTAGAEASLRLVIITRGGNDDIDMSKDKFTDLFAHFDLDPIILQQIGYSGYGFHHYEEPHKNAYSFYVGTYVFALAWSFNPVTMKTNAILLLRNTPVLKGGKLALTSIQQTLQMYKKCIHSPLFLLFVVYINLCRMSQFAIHTIVVDLRRVETVTGHGPGLGPVPMNNTDYKQPEIHKLSKAAQEVANIQVHIANLVRHDSYINDMAQYLEQDGLVDKWRDLAPQVVAGPWDAAFHTLSPLVPSLKKLTSDLGPSLKYLETRAMCQSSVIRSMMTHEDARLSTQLAEAARKDSSAMRSIAMMTMIFLPGAFFAAIFSMPSLPQPAQDHFWIFWACTAPATILVFFVWRSHRWSQKKWIEYKNAQAARMAMKLSEDEEGPSSDGSTIELQIPKMASS